MGLPEYANPAGYLCRGSVQSIRSFEIMRLSIATIITLLGLTLFGFASVNFNGTWVLDLKASDSPEPMMKRMGASVLERKLATSTKLESIYSQSGNLLTITTRGPGFSRTEHLRLDGHPETKTEKRTGPYTIRTLWAHHGKELISTSTFRTDLTGRQTGLHEAVSCGPGGQVSGTPDPDTPITGQRRGIARSSVFLVAAYPKRAGLSSLRYVVCCGKRPQDCAVFPCTRSKCFVTHDAACSTGPYRSTCSSAPGGSNSLRCFAQTASVMPFRSTVIWFARRRAISSVCGMSR
jgi:hypothetical protein